ncbi:MAG: bifunctional DNA primase/polymerase [Polyangiaceae bacterium]|nr:bifunctional DNA primase/polymerase [Polyangiaceae bacterium]
MSTKPDPYAIVPEAEVQRLMDSASPLQLQGWDRLQWIAQTDKLDAIRIYAKLGLHPILLHGIAADGSCTCGRPGCGAAGKHPVAQGWQSAALDVPALLAGLEKDWRLNVGLRMGPQPGGFDVIAIDVDGALELLAPLEAEHGKLPQTLTAKTAKGFHLLFRVSDSANFGNAVRIAPGIDVRSRGGQIVVGPSRHASGATYRWVNCQEPAVLP